MKAIVFSNSRRALWIASLIALFAFAVVPLQMSGMPVALADSDPVIAAAGDIACDPASLSFNKGDGNASSCRQKYTSDLLMDTGLAAVLPLGDVQYECGGYTAFLQSYDRSWGRQKSISHPVVGNHEYLLTGGTDCNDLNEGAKGYFRYFGAAAGDPSQGYYSYDIGSWHLIALNSNCGDAGGCGYGSPQMNWLLTDLAAHPNLCTLAYWHIPLFSSGGRAGINTQSIWEVLYSHDVDVVLNGHDHIYERFAPQAPDGTPDSERGIQEFVVGTGGANLTDIEQVAANSLVRNNDTYGILKMTLHPSGYDWQFVPEAGKTFTDSGSAQCHGELSDSPLATPTVLPTLTPAPTPVTTAYRFAPAADAYVSKPKPASNFGVSNLLRVYGGPLGASYMRFNVQGLPGTVARVTLQLYAHTASSDGFQVRAVTDPTWDESKVTFATAPPVGDLIASAEPFQARQWTRVDLTPLIKGNGTYDIVLITFNAAPLSFASREAILPHRPRLVVEVLGAPNPALGATQSVDGADP